MKTRYFLLIILAICSCNFANAQKSVNDYKYVMVPITFEFLSDPDQYRLNTLTKLLFEKHGFITIMEDEKLPDDVIANNCLILKANVLKEPGAFVTKLQVQLENCKKEIVFTSSIGKSREKKYPVAYSLALREAFKSFDTFKYVYKENETIVAYGNKAAKANNAEIKKLQEEIKTLKEEKEVVNALPPSVKPIAIAETKIETLPLIDANNEQLHAKEVFNGFILLDASSNEVMTIFKSGVTDVFIIKGKDAIIYKKGASWIYSETSDHDLVTKVINIKF